MSNSSAESFTDIGDYFESYPSKFDSNAQGKMSSKAEFIELASTPKEKLPVGGGFYKHQRVIHRFLTFHSNLFIMDETGTGKGPSVLGFTEKIVSEIIKERLYPGTSNPRLSHFKQIVILCRGEAQKNEVRRQLVCKIAPERYLTTAVKESTTEKSQKKQITMEIRKWYNITTYQKFSNEIKAIKTEEELIERFAHTFFWVDEAHNLIVDYDEEGSPDQQLKNEILGSLDRLFHNVPFCTRVISSATIMLNDVRDFIPVFNLILPKNGAIPYNMTPDVMAQLSDLECSVWFPGIDPDNVRSNRYDLSSYFQGGFPINENLEDMPIERFEVRVRDLVVYVRALDTGARLEYMGQQVADVPYNLYVVPMSDFQTHYYDTLKGKGYQINKIEAATAVYPDGNYTENTITANATLDEKANNYQQVNNYITSDKDDFQSTQLLKEAIRANGVAYYSSKYPNIINSFFTEPGVIFIYEPYIHGSGSNYTGSVLELYGIRRFTENSSIFKTTEGSTRSFCGSTVGSREIRPDYKLFDENGNRILRYAVLTTDTTPGRRDSIMEVFYSRENIDGHLIKGIIATRIGRDGINIDNATVVHMPFPERTTSARHQAISRVMRSTSHDALIEREEKRLISLGQDPSTAYVTVKVYLYASVKSDGSQTYDFNIYRQAAEKEKKIAKVMRMLEICCITAWIHRQRNIRPTDVPNSPACRFSSCEYLPYRMPSQLIDYSTADLYYADEEIERVDNKIVDIFSQLSFLSFDEIQSFLPDCRPTIIKRALTRLIVEKTPMVNNYGFVAYLRETQAGFSLTQDYNTVVGDRFSIWYQKGLIAREEVPLADYVLGKEQSRYQMYITDLERSPAGSIITKYSEHTPTTQSNILEDALTKEYNGVSNDYTRAIRAKNRYFIFDNLPYPIDEIEAEKRSKSNGETTTLTMNDIQAIMRVDYNSYQKINAHILLVNAQDEGYSRYRDSSSYLQGRAIIRIYDHQKKMWRNANQYEKIPLNRQIQYRIYLTFRSYRDRSRYFGHIINNTFRIVDRDASESNKGRDCTSYPLTELFKVMFTIGVPPAHTYGLPYSGPYGDYSRQDLMVIIMTKYKDIHPEFLQMLHYDQLMYILVWIHSIRDKQSICGYIRGQLNNLGLLIHIS